MTIPSSSVTIVSTLDVCDACANSVAFSSETIHVAGTPREILTHCCRSDNIDAPGKQLSTHRQGPKSSAYGITDDVAVLRVRFPGLECLPLWLQDFFDRRVSSPSPISGITLLSLRVRPALPGRFLRLLEYGAL